MRAIEIFLKSLFLIISIYVITTRNVGGFAFLLLLHVAIILGLFLIFNKKQSYRYPANYPGMKNVFLLRRVEGFVLIIAAVIGFLHL